MILYHFTAPTNVESILRQGLMPAQRFDSALGYGRNAVWLTTKPTREISERHKVLWRERRPDLYSDSQEWLPAATVRLSVRIPSHDRKLVQYVPWLRKHPWEDCPDIDDEIVRVGMKDFWIYFGVITPDRLSVEESA